jgi:hypothetical protein
MDKPPNRKLIAKVQMTKNKMFPLNLRSVNLSQPYAQNVSNSYGTLLWHSRFGHLPFRSLSFLQKHSMFKGLPTLNEQDNPCESCVLGNHKGDNFPTSSHREKEHLEFVHIDLCGRCKPNPLVKVFIF